MKKILVIAPHPDDETLGVGGTILKRINHGHKVAWLIVTCSTNAKEIKKRNKQVSLVKKKYKFSKVFELNFSSSELDKVLLKVLIEMFSKIFNEFRPNEVFVPHINDAHTDHQKIFKAVSATTKSFRYPFINKILSYETVSETGYGLKKITKKGFDPNYYINIDNYIKRKLQIAKIYKTEIKKHPFPRSLKNIKALAIVRGAESNNRHAEAFELLRYIEK